MSDDILIYAEQEDGDVRRISLEIASKAADIASRLGSTVHVLSVGAGASSTGRQLGEYGVDVVHAAEDSVFDEYQTDPVVEAAASLITTLEPRLVIFPYSQDGKDAAGRLSARLDIPAVANVIGLEVSDDGIEATETIFGGSYTTTVRGKGEGTLIVLARPNAFKAEVKGKTAKVELLRVEAGDEIKRVRRGEVVQEVGAPLAVDEASIIVSGGRGLGGPEPFEMLEDLAKEIGGVVGASRAAVDAGWISYAHQVGQTGKTVKPQVYIAIGISGAVQHRVGMQTADTIIAINKDGDAPIFQLADLGVVGDLFQIVPALTEEIRKRKA